MAHLHSSIRLASLAALLVAGPMMLAQQSAPAPTTPKAVTYRIAGKVVDAHTGAKLGRCSVQIADVKDRSQSQTVTSGDDGAFSFEGLPLGKYSLTAERRGYLPQAFEEHDQYSTAVAVGPGLDSENLIFKLTAESLIEGTVTDEAGEPVRGAQVRLFRDEDANGIRSTQQRHTVTTDDLGKYEIPGLRPGAFFLVVTAHPWYAQRLHTMQTDQNQSGSQETEAASQSQALDVAYPTTFYPGVTDQDSATPIPVKGGDRLEANITLAAQPAIRLRVKLPQAGDQGNGGVSVMLSQTIFGQVESLPTQMTGTQGAIELEGVLPGHYDVTLSHFTPGQGQGAAKHFETDVASGATDLSEDSAVGDVTLTGKVVSIAGKLPPAGITLQDWHGRRQQYGALNDAGEFSMTVAPGIYQVIGAISGMYFASIKATGASLTGRMLTVKAGDSPKLEIVDAAGHDEIEGTALRAGKPASAVMVLLAPEDSKNNHVLFRRDQSDSDGTFDLANIVPGRYRLLAIEEGWELEWANPAVLQAFLAKSIPLEIKSGDHLKQSVEVQPR